MDGLTRREVEERIENGQINANENPNTRTVKQIILQNSLTFFNFLNLSLVVMVLLVGSYKNTLFFGVIIFNTVIGIVQEIRAKAIIDKLAILTQSKTVVLREGKKWSIATDQLVIDDIIYLKTGDQVPADAEVVEGAIEVNESLLTGEADNLTKRLGDQLFSGSFVTSGEAACRIVHVGKDNYAAQITSEAKEYKKHNSELRNSMNAILKVVSIMVIPVGALMFYKQYYMVGNTLRDSVVAMVASVLGMIPDGLVLLTSIALTLGAVYLAQKKTLVQEMYCIETLAHV
ncbi:MAG: HAD-IC family P-type ATPase, partial [Clostridiales bacterium]|nr:HAD-IC family P-type ATPase [Candidatus Blautia equi]